MHMKLLILPHQAQGDQAFIGPQRTLIKRLITPPVTQIIDSGESVTAGNFALVRITTTEVAGYTLHTTIPITEPGHQGERLVLINASGQTITINHGTNCRLPGAANYDLLDDEAIESVYDLSKSSWILIQ